MLFILDSVLWLRSRGVGSEMILRVSAATYVQGGERSIVATMRLRSHLRFAPAEVRLETRPDGAVLLRSPQTLGPYARAVGDWLVHWAERAPDRVFLAERGYEGNVWRRLTYREALDRVRRIGQALLDRGLDRERPVVILSENRIDHALLALGAMHVGIPVAPISPAYSLMSKDFAKLKYIFELLKPGLVYADSDKFAPALAAVGAKATDEARLHEPTPGSTLARA